MQENPHSDLNSSALASQDRRLKQLAGIVIVAFGLQFLSAYTDPPCREWCLSRVVGFSLDAAYEIASASLLGSVLIPWLSRYATRSAVAVLIAAGLSFALAVAFVALRVEDCHLNCDGVVTRTFVFLSLISIITLAGTVIIRGRPIATEGI
jgi:hypothetical protein